MDAIGSDARTRGRIELRGIGKTYGTERVVSGFDADIRPGEFFSLLGPSGSGKTTTLMMIAGFTPIDEGRLLADGRDITALPPQRRGFGVIFQNYAIFPHLNVFENVAFPLRARRLPNPDIRSRVAWALDLVQLGPYATRDPRQLSGGQQQRVAIARAVVFHPGVVLMDEPLSALDRTLRSAMQAELRDIQQRLGTTVIYVTHDQEEAMAMSDRVAIMHRGRVEQIGAPRAVYARPANSFVGRFLGAANLLDGTVIAVQDTEAAFRTEAGVVLRAQPGPGVAVGCRATLFFRPERVAFNDGDSGGEINRLRGQFRRTTFLGATLRCGVEIAGGGHVLVDMPNDGRAPLPAVGEEVGLAWPIADSLVLPP